MDLALIAPVTVGSSGAEPHVPGPDVAFGRVLATAEPTNAARVIAGLRQQFRTCYNRALSEDPNLVGVVALDLMVGPDGQVTSVRASQAKGVSSSVVACFSLAARQAQFSAPAGGRAMLSIPLTLVRQ
jgi:hypothetical protein